MSKTMRTHWLDFGGADAEYCEWLASQLDDSCLFICLDPLYRVHMIEQQAVRPSSQVSAAIVRVGGGLGPSEMCSNPSLPIRDSTIHHIICRFVLHLYLGIIDTFAAESSRVLISGGDISLRIPDWHNPESATNIRMLVNALEEQGLLVIENHDVPDEAITMWDEIYKKMSYLIVARKQLRGP